MVPDASKENHFATLDVCLGGVFIPRGERIPTDLYETWKRRIVALGLEPKRVAVPEIAP